MKYSPFLAKTSPLPVDISVDYAKGNCFYDQKGKEYIDLISGIGVSNIGHNHPHVVESVKNQLDRHSHVMVYGEFDYPVQARYASKICSLLGTGFEQVFFTNSGTEANEGAVKLAKRITRRTKLISCKGAYHGSTHGSLSLAGNESRKRAFRPLLPDVHFLGFNEVDDLELIDQETAAVIIEPIQGDAGVRIPFDLFLRELRQKCDNTGAILIFDEIQTGFGRTGKWFAFEHWEVKPDIITLGKALGGGLPLGAFVTTKNYMECLTHDPPLGHITTFGGNPLCCAAGLATAEVIEKEELILSVEMKGQLFEDLLKHPQIKEVRRKGLMMAVELENEDLVNEVVKKSIEDGILIYWFLSTKNAFRIAPPLTLTEKEIHRACEVILSNLDKHN